TPVAGADNAAATSHLARHDRPRTAGAPSPSASPKASSPARNGAGGPEQQPSPAQLAAQAKAEELHQQLREQADDADVARAALDDASQSAAAELETYRIAVQV